MRMPASQFEWRFQRGLGALHHRWAILAVLFVVRLTMAFQFQSVAAVAPLLGRQYGVGLADIGILIGLYFTPGIALAGRRHRPKVRRQDDGARRPDADADRQPGDGTIRFVDRADRGTAGHW